MFVKALPAPPSLKVFRNLEVLDDEDKRLMEIQRTIMFQSEQNRRQIELALEKKEEAAVSLNNSSSSANHNTLPSPVAVTNSGINPCSIPPATATASSNQEPSGINNNSSESSSSQSAHPLAIATGSVPNEGGVVKSASKFMSTSDGDDESSDSSRSDSDSEDEQMGRTYGNVNNSGGSNNNTNNRRPTNVVQIDDEQDEDLVLLLDPTFPEGFQRCNTEFIPRSATLLQGRNSRGGPCHSQMITLVKQGLINSVSHHPNRQLANIFKSMYQEMQFQLSYFSPCLVAGIEYSVQLPKDNEVQIQLTAVALGQFMDLGSSSSSNYDGDTYSEEEREIASAFAAMDEPPTVASSVLGGGSLVSGFSGLKFNMGKSLLSQGRQATKISVQSIPDEPQQQQPPQQQQQQDEAAAEAEDVVFPMDEEDDKDDLLAARKGGAARGSNATGAGTEEFGVSGAGDSTTFGGGKSLSDHFYKPVEITPLSYIPQVKIDRFLGRLSLHFVKEANIVFEAGLGQYGMGGFSHTFVTELYSILRAHTVALGGNGLIGVTIDQSVFSESIKNQGYALISASGDVVQYSQIKEANRYQHASGSFDSLQK